MNRLLIIAGAIIVALLAAGGMGVWLYNAYTVQVVLGAGRLKSTQS